MRLSPKDKDLLAKCHPDLRRVIERAAADNDDTKFKWFITCTLRTVAEQRKLIEAGASQTMRSRHLPGATTKLAHAVDLAVTMNSKVKWDWPLYSALAQIVKAAAKAEGVPIEWGGDWKSFKDGPHFQLPWAKYPG